MTDEIPEGASVVNQEPVKAHERLADVLDAAGQTELASRVRQGEFDYRATMLEPTRQLKKELHRIGARDLMTRVEAGEFDPTEDEQVAWASRPL